ncbi:TetR/AcrR family transcriptional regulator [Rhizomonospora bruguierae]|uniref:TetR/AcrR family transcriptional regulator n=1 Tax=Rhizomonospora bruguierae TaxID=1581705 RepID=UPI001BCD5A0C|nr:TetR/AcrR family transcriptional regulator [Micromonospora sp. NBRC 107566]
MGEDPGAGGSAGEPAHSHPGDRALRLLWGVDPPPARGPKARWSLNDVALRALALADKGGLENVSLAKVAAELGVTTTAIYRYVDSKDVLVALMVDAAIGDPPTLTEDSLEDRCRAWVRALRERYRLHPWLADVQPTGIPRQPRPFGWIEAMVTATAEYRGVDGLRLSLLFEGLVRAYSTIARGVVADTAPAAWMSTALAERFPALARVAQRDWSNVDAELDYSLEIVLRGLARP